MKHRKRGENIVRASYLKNISNIEKEGKFTAYSDVNELRKSIEKGATKTRKTRLEK